MRPLLLALVGVSIVVPPELAFAQAPPAGRRLAFLVGVKEYDHSQLKKLDYPERDVDVFADVLTKSGFDRVVVLTTGRGAKDAALKPTVENIEKQLADLLTPPRTSGRQKVTKHDTILVALAGHGIQPLGSDLAYFCPQDANPTIIAAVDKTPGKAKFPDTLVAIDALLTTLDDSGVGHKLLLMDACRNDPGVRGGRRDAGGVDRVKVSALPPDTAVLLSCSPGQFAFEDTAFGGGHGAFFHHVIEGFQGAAVDAEEGGVTFDSLVKHVGKTVPKSVDTVFGKDGGQQKPNRIVNLSTDTLLLARVTPVKPPMPPAPIPKPIPTPQTPSRPMPADGPKAGALVAGTRAGQEWEGNGLKTKFCWCPDTTAPFLMGSPNDEKDRETNEDQVSVTLTGFWLGKHEVTQSEWQSVLNTSLAAQRDKADKSYKLYGEGPSHPMYYVSHDEATDFAKEFTKQERAAGRLPGGWEYRLPTEAQWEYGCRAGTKTRFISGDDEKELEAYAWFFANAESTTHAVGTKQANAWGLCDMHGNVWEWCRDWYDGRLTGGKDPEVTKQASSRVNRGGGWNLVGSSCRSADRVRLVPSNRSHNLGFRLAAVRVSQ